MQSLLKTTTFKGVGIAQHIVLKDKAWNSYPVLKYYTTFFSLFPLSQTFLVVKSFISISGTARSIGCKASCDYPYSVSDIAINALNLLPANFYSFTFLAEHIKALKIPHIDLQTHVWWLLNQKDVFSVPLQVGLVTVQY